MSIANTTTDNSVFLVQKGDLPCLQIRHPAASALIALQGAQVLEYTPAGAHPLIWLSEQAAFEQGQSVRGGIPLCWPWFGDLTRNPAAVQHCLGQSSAPAHGWARNRPWLIEQISSEASGVQLALRYPTPGNMPVPWAAQVDLYCRLHIGSTLSIELEVCNHSSQPLALSQALHSYFAISHITKVHIDGLQQVPYLDTLRQWNRFTDNEPLFINEETDRIYLDTPTEITLVDEGWQRRIHLQCAQSRSAVVWNPWIEKSRRLSQFADDAWQRMLCIETARIMENHLLLAPGQQDSMKLVLSQSAC